MVSCDVFTVELAWLSMSSLYLSTLISLVQFGNKL